jgi:hypothetical protein
MHLTGYYHHDGGVLAIAASLDRAKELITAEASAEKPPDLEAEPDLVADVSGDTPERVIIFPDAGCC